MKILVLNGSPRPNGATADMVVAFAKGASEAGHTVSVVPVARRNVKGCLGCEYCHGKGGGNCVQKDDLQELYPEFLSSDMVVFASPIYYFTLSAQLQAVIHRTYAFGIPRNVKQTALILSSGDAGVYEPPSANTTTPLSSGGVWRIWAFSPPMGARTSLKQSGASCTSLGAA